MESKPNKLVLASSPYLLQHAYNPVHWEEWGNEAWKRASEENKLVLVSIGYSACHWCHVMEHECFEDLSVAELMNERFVNIKVDREERPDVDMVYMDACQLITGRGGWPLNVFCLPNGKPIHAGTYFPKNNWLETLQKLSDFYRENPVKAEEYAQRLTEGMGSLETVLLKKSNDNYIVPTDSLYEKISLMFDWTNGGLGHAPKFPMPPALNFVLSYYIKSQNSRTGKYIELTLQKMALGGIYDHLGGGFCRYSVDASWKVPHFEKMLYDNGQLLSLYAKAYSQFKNDIYKNAAEGIIDFVLSELYKDGLFYSALDADSEGIEGKYYVWTSSEIESVLSEEGKEFARFYGIDRESLWEHGLNVLMQTEPLENYCLQYDIQREWFENYIYNCKEKLIKERNKRTKPGLDNKVIVAWNALMAIGFIDAYKFLGNNIYKKHAEKCIQLLLEKCVRDDRFLYRILSDKEAKIPGFLEDYAFLIEALIGLYEISGTEEYLINAKLLAEKVYENFFDEEGLVFSFASKQSEGLVVKKYDLSDDVMPSANSSLAISLAKLGHCFGVDPWIAYSEAVLKRVNPQFAKYPSSYGNWMCLQIQQEKGLIQWVHNLDPSEFWEELRPPYHPWAVYGYATPKSSIPFLMEKYSDEPVHYVCKGLACFPPTKGFAEALKLSF